MNRSFLPLRRTNRRGISLFEVALAIFVLSLLVSMATVMFASLLKAQRQFTLRERQRREFVRLDAMLRSDVHAATASVAIEPEKCVLKNDADETWRYEREENWLVRVHSRGDQQLQREAFFVRPGSKISFKLVPAGSRQLIELQIQAESPASGAGSRQTGYLAQALLGGGIAPSQEPRP
ncbi:Tfp pilus assembly protein FimT/FimU [Anatilimnocola sp. NA78]|uniref:pilus assembly FimT family protein n=1 Tax=Anatilimnocola sp. NA78 TaxID=3415683 RepID=UPI003CE55B33